MSIIKRIEKLEKKVKFLREDVNDILKAFREAKKTWRKLMKKTRRGEGNGRD